MILGFKERFVDKIKSGTKIHTIRKFGSRDWGAGRKIHFATGVRTGDYNCFHEAECKGTQTILISQRKVYMTGRFLKGKELEELAINDGFDSIEDFHKWFDPMEPFAGKVIHWTDKRY